MTDMSIWDVLDKIDRREEILFRQFSPVTGYEPDPKREEWQGPEDCKGCPYSYQAKIGLRCQIKHGYPFK